MDDTEIAFDERGLVPCVVQDWRTGEVLTLAYMNAESLQRTRESGEMHFFSRSRGELWHKGASSGNVQALKAIRYDCDGDALLALFEPGPRVSHRRAHLLLPWRARAPGSPRGAARARAHDRLARRRAAKRLLYRRAAERS